VVRNLVDYDDDDEDEDGNISEFDRFTVFVLIDAFSRNDFKTSLAEFKVTRLHCKLLDMQKAPDFSQFHKSTPEMLSLGCGEVQGINKPNGDEQWALCLQSKPNCCELVLIDPMEIVYDRINSQ
jgi:hypothetical protein